MKSRFQIDGANKFFMPSLTTDVSVLSSKYQTLTYRKDVLPKKKNIWQKGCKILFFKIEAPVLSDSLKYTQSRF